MTRLVLAFGILLLCLPALANRAEDEAALLALHQEIIDAHKNIGLDTWLAKGVEPYISANRGEISYPSKQPAPKSSKSISARPSSTITATWYRRW